MAASGNDGTILLVFRSFSRHICGAVDKSATKAKFSMGTGVVLVAPGVDVISSVLLGRVEALVKFLEIAG